MYFELYYFDTTYAITLQLTLLYAKSRVPGYYPPCSALCAIIIYEIA